MMDAQEMNTFRYSIEKLKVEQCGLCLVIQPLIPSTKKLDMIRKKEKETKEYESADKAFDLLHKFVD